MWFFKLKDFFVPSDEEIELMVKALHEIERKKKNTCCDPGQQACCPDTVGE